MSDDVAKQLLDLKQDLVWITFVLDRLEKKVDLIQKLVLDPPQPEPPPTQSRNLI